MAGWLKKLEKFARFHCRANDHAPEGKVNFNCHAHLNPRLVDLNPPTLYQPRLKPRADSHKIRSPHLAIFFHIPPLAAALGWVVVLIPHGDATLIMRWPTSCPGEASGTNGSMGLRPRLAPDQRGNGETFAAGRDQEQRSLAGVKTAGRLFTSTAQSSYWVSPKISTKGMPK
jgi:hypothetical protein